MTKNSTEQKKFRLVLSNPFWFFPRMGHDLGQSKSEKEIVGILKFQR